MFINRALSMQEKNTQKATMSGYLLGKSRSNSMEKISPDLRYNCFMAGVKNTQMLYRALNRVGLTDIDDDVLEAIMHAVVHNYYKGIEEYPVYDAVEFEREIQEMIEIGEAIVIDGVLGFNPDNEMSYLEIDYE